MCHMSRVTCHVSCVRCQVSHVSYYIFFFLQRGGASRGRVCYQWGLPRLVFNGFATFSQYYRGYHTWPCMFNFILQYSRFNVVFIQYNTVLHAFLFDASHKCSSYTDFHNQYCTPFVVDSLWYLLCPLIPLSFILQSVFFFSTTFITFKILIICQGNYGNTSKYFDSRYLARLETTTK